MKSMGKKRKAILDLSVKAQVDNDEKAKVAYLIAMLETLAKDTRYELDVVEAIDNYHRCQETR